MAEAILSVGIEFIGQLLVDEAKFLIGVREQVELLQDNLKHMLWFLRYADKKQDVRESIKHWVSEFSGIAYEAANLVEDYAFRFGSTQRNSAGGCTYKLQRYARIFTRGHTLHDLGTEIQSLNTRISDLTQKFDKYGVPRIMEGEGPSRTSVQQQLRHTYSSKAEEDLTVGTLESDVDLLVGHLQNRCVVSISGMGGIGKTTLARKLYRDPRLKQYFKAFAWCCISQKWETEDILQRILVKLIDDEKESTIKKMKQDALEGKLRQELEPTVKKMGKDELVRKLRQKMQDRRCLIVLDDIWSTAAWDSIKDAFCVSNQGSKVLLTTRNRDVADHVDRDGYHHQPKLLTEEESWELLKIKCLKDINCEDDDDYHKFKDLGIKMVRYCQGLPLAVVALGGILETKKSPTDWSIVHDNIKSYMRRDENSRQIEGEVSKILAFSYYDLPYELKPCFLYLGKFKEDSHIEVARLYQLWIAEGMVLASDSIRPKTMMDVAESYLEELAKRCMVEVELYEEGQPAITRFKSCQLHDLMRDLCLDKAKEEIWHEVFEGHQNIGVPLANCSLPTERLYGFVIRCLPEDFDKYVARPKEQTKHVRSFWCEPLDRHERICDGRRMLSQVNNLKMLRVLKIEGCDMKSTMSQIRRRYSKSPLKCIGHLIHLRLLSLNSSKIFELPSSLGNLNYLETLDLRNIGCSRITDEFWKLGHLRYIYLSDSDHKLRLDRLGKQVEILEGVTNKNCDFEYLSKLINLRALRVTVSEKLEDVEQIIHHISSFNYIRFTSLLISNCYFVSDSNSNNNKGLVVLEQVFFCKNLHELELTCTSFKRLPDYQPYLFPFSSLTELLLCLTNIEEDPMPTLEKFPKLRRLSLDFNSFVGKEMICSAMGFPQLKFLWLCHLKNLEEWKVDEGAMPKLSSLQIHYCEKLEMIPDGLRSITTLSEITLLKMREEFVNRVRIVNGIEGADFDKIRHVASVTIISPIMQPPKNQDPPETRDVGVQADIKEGEIRLRDNCSSTITASK